MTSALVIVLLALSADISASADEPLAGWDRARWGMSASEIQAAYPAATAHKRDTYDLR